MLGMTIVSKLALLTSACASVVFVALVLVH